jgi:hypothetical protein
MEEIMTFIITNNSEIPFERTQKKYRTFLPHRFKRAWWTFQEQPSSPFRGASENCR